MSGFLLRIIINAVVLFIVCVKIPGIFVDTLGGTLLGAAIIGLANAAIRPVLSLASVPFTFISLGGFTFFTNLLAPLMLIKALPGVQVTGFLASAASVALLTVCSYTLSKVIHDR